MSYEIFIKNIPTFYLKVQICLRKGTYLVHSQKFLPDNTYFVYALACCLPALDFSLGLTYSQQFIHKYLEKEYKSPSGFFNQHLTTCISAWSLAVMFENALLGEQLTDSAETGMITGKSTSLSNDLNERYIEMFKCLFSPFFSLILFPSVGKIISKFTSTFCSTVIALFPWY